MVPAHYGRPKSSGGKTWEWVVCSEDDNSNFTDVSRSNIIATRRRRIATASAPKSNVCEVPGPPPAPGSPLKVEHSTKPLSSSPTFGSNGGMDAMVMQDYVSGPNSFESTTETSIFALDLQPGISSQNETLQQSLSGGHDAVEIDGKRNEPNANEAQISFGMGERPDARMTKKQNRLDVGFTETQHHIGIDKKLEDTATTEDQRDLDIRAERPDSGSSGSHCHISMKKQPDEVDVTRVSNHLDMNYEQFGAPVAPLQNLALSDLSSAVNCTIYPNCKLGEYRSPYSPETQPSFGVGAGNNAAYDMPLTQEFSTMSSISDHTRPTEPHLEDDRGQIINTKISELARTPRGGWHGNASGIFPEKSNDRALPTAPDSPTRASKRQRTNAGDTAASPCTTRTSTSANLFASSSPLSSPPSSPETSLTPPDVCASSDLCIRFFRDPGLKAAWCSNNFKALYQTYTPPANKVSTIKGVRTVKALQPYYANSQVDKPDPIGQPLVWANKRQQLCQTLPYYNAYQSGAYTSEGYVLGFLCDKEVGKHDKFDDEIIISRIGGGRIQDSSGNFVQSKDQSMNSTYTSFMRSMKEDRPIGVIAGQGNSISPSKLPHYYNVLDWFHITDVWCELNNGCKTWMARFEKINLLERSWWSPRGAEPLTPLTPAAVNGPRAPTAHCTACKRESKLIYNQGWTCLNNDCREFFQFPTCLIEDDLDYSRDFLKERTHYRGGIPGPLAPPLLTDEDCAKAQAFGIEKLFAKGIVCPVCGCCSRRIEWSQWSCENTRCTFIHRVGQKAVPVHEAMAGYEIPKSCQPMCHSSIRPLTPIIHGHYDIFEYQVPGPSGEVVGFIRLFKSACIINQQPDGPDELFQQMQTNEFGLRRNPSRNKGSPNEILTSHWAANWGAPYKYGVAQISKGFDQTPTVLIKALKRLTWAGEFALTSLAHEHFVPFNELLSIGYFENSTIGYHDDGEKELGPTVATLSLGCSATMMFRPKAKSGIKGAQKKPNARGTHPDVLKVTLEHGDMVIMHGSDIQKFYEHSVVPHGKLRFALTARYVRPELMLPDEQEYALRAGQLPDGSDEYDYTGDVDAVSVAPSKDLEEEIRRHFRIVHEMMQFSGIANARVVELLSEVIPGLRIS